MNHATWAVGKPHQDQRVIGPPSREPQGFLSLGAAVQLLSGRGPGG